MKDLDEKKAYNKAYQLAHAEEIKVKRKAYRLAHKKEIKAYEFANSEKKKASDKAYRLTHKKKAKAYRLAHKEKLKAQHSRYMKSYWQKRPGRRIEKKRKRRALERGNSHEPYTGNYVFERDGWKCQLCGRRINRRLKHPHPYSKSIDHIIPLSKGGSDSPINVQATHLRCNLSKQARGGGQLRLIS